MKPLWFKAKTYKWGWLILLAFVAFQFWNFFRLDKYSHSASDTIRPFIIQTFLAMAALIFICYKTGEKPEWRWGGKK